MEKEKVRDTEQKYNKALDLCKEAQGVPPNEGKILLSMGCINLLEVIGRLAMQAAAHNAIEGQMARLLSGFVQDGNLTPGQKQQAVDMLGVHRLSGDVLDDAMAFARNRNAGARSWLLGNAGVDSGDPEAVKAFFDKAHRAFLEPANPCN